ncbi:MAG: hypothetical protein FWD46_01365 [Cystobacterineae bacterium]|nr:hypothetical protein [Cystobacterineae bacterium]
MGTQIGNGGDEVVHHGLRRACVAMKAFNFFASVDEILNVEFETASAFMTGEIDGHIYRRIRVFFAHVNGVPRKSFRGDPRGGKAQKNPQYFAGFLGEVGQGVWGSPPRSFYF